MPSSILVPERGGEVHGTGNSLAAKLGGLIRKRSWRWIATSSGLVLVLVALFLFRWRQIGFDWRAFAHTFVALRWDWLAAAAVVAVASYYGRALRWAVLIRPVQPNPSVWRLFAATAIGFTAVVIFGRPGEFVRPYLIALKEKVPFSSQLAAWLLERIYDLLAALLIFGFALGSIGRSGVEVGPRIAWVLQVGGYAVAAICLVCLTVLVLLHSYSEAMRTRLLDALSFLPPRYHQKAGQLATAFVQGAQATRTRGALLAVIGYTFLEWALIAACYVCLFRGFPELAELGIADVLIFIGFVSFGSIVQIPGVGGGMQLVSIVVLTELFDLPLELASGVAIIVWIITFVVVVPFGLLLLFREGLNWEKLKQMEAEASL